MSIDNLFFKSDKQDWQTPRSIFDPLHAEFQFTIDAAATAQNTLLPRFWTIEDNALRKSWASERVWCNPPYGREQVGFIKKAAAGEADIAVLLVPARTDTAVWHDFVFGRAYIRFLRGRVKFLPVNEPAPFPSALLIYEKTNPPELPLFQP